MIGFQQDRTSSGPCKVLIVDDDPGIRSLLRLQLAPLGCEIVSAEDTPKAIEVIEEDYIDVVLLDLMLPGSSGMELLRHIRKHELQVEVIVLTAHASLETAIEAIRLGAYDYVTKPFNADNLRTTVARAIEKQQLTSNLETIYQVGQKIALTLDGEQVVEAVMETTTQALGGEICCLWMMDQERGELYLLAERSPSGTPELPPPPPGCGWTMGDRSRPWQCTMASRSTSATCKATPVI